MKLPDFLLFASDAEVAVLWGAVLIVLAAIARYAEGRRLRRARIDSVGWVPWTGLFLLLAVVGAALLGFGAIGLLRT